MINKYTFVSASNLDIKIDISDISSWTYNMIPIEHVAKVLSNTPRFKGTLNNDEFYSVALHCLIMVDILKSENKGYRTQYYGLLHELDEVIFWDIPSPTKRYIFDTCPDFKRLYMDAQFKLNEIYGLPKLTSPLIKEFDKYLYIQEACSLACNNFIKIEHSYLSKEAVLELKQCFNKSLEIYKNKYQLEVCTFPDLSYNGFIEQEFIERYYELRRES